MEEPLNTNKEAQALGILSYEVNTYTVKVGVHEEKIRKLEDFVLVLKERIKVYSMIGVGIGNLIGWLISKFL